MIRYSSSNDPPSKVKAGVLVVPVFQGPEPGPGVREVGLESAYRAARLNGKKNENLLVTRRDGDGFAADAVLMVGVGERKDFTVTAARRALGKVAPSLRRFGTVATTFAQAFPGKRGADAVQAAAEGIGLGAYRFDRYKTKKEDPSELESATILVPQRADAKAVRTAIRRADAIVDAVSWARDLVNTPAGDMPPATIAREAQKMARAVGLRCKVWGEAELVKGGFGGILGVGAGSPNPPRLIELEYHGGGSSKPLALTGKGISFDSGGLSIKDAKGMETMKDDMGGAASILATMKVLATLKPKVNVIAAVPSAENMPSGTATKPGDVLTHRGGKTSEVLNTDAEGRLVLADALAYLAQLEPAAIVDAATLTGSCMIALGDAITGAMGNDRSLIGQLLAAGEQVGEPAWQLPLHKDYRSQIDSSIADVKNVGDRYGGAITAAWFLAEFVGEIPWVHLDVAGPAFADKGTDLGPRGATGVPVRMLVRWVLDRAK